jgi:hemolysin III
MSSVTHGIGFVLSVVGAMLVYSRVTRQGACSLSIPRQDNASQASPSTQQVAAGVYSLSLMALYLTSCIYHSSFQVYSIKVVLHVVDQCCIYLLIAGTYTPLLSITLHSDSFYSVGMLGVMWLCCLLGLSMSSLYFGPARKYCNLTLFLIMGWSGAICLPAMASKMSPRGLHWIAAGGVFYTAGVPFFVLDTDPTTSMLHVIWHLFVLAGSAAHWWAIFAHILL